MHKPLHPAGTINVDILSLNRPNFTIRALQMASLPGQTKKDCWKAVFCTMVLFSLSLLAAPAVHQFSLVVFHLYRPVAQADAHVHGLAVL